MNHEGEIERLSKIACPDVAVITKIAPAHIGLLGSIDNITKAKLEIIRGLKNSGTLVIPEGLGLPEETRKLADSKKHSIVRFGFDSSKSSCWVDDITDNGIDGLVFNLKSGGEKASITIGALGVHNANNVACASLAAQALFPQITPSKIANKLVDYSPAAMRLQTHKLDDGRILIDDSYNASPEAMKAALAIMSKEKSYGKRVALVLGDMLELGEFAIEYHKEIGRLVKEIAPECVVAVGEYSSVLIDESKEDCVVYCAQQELDEGEVYNLVNSASWDILLVKGSRGVGLDRFVRYFRCKIQDQC